MFDDPALRFTGEEAITFLGKLMPAGFAGTDVLAEPPPIVQAYRNVYGRFPSGWPPA